MATLTHVNNTRHARVPYASSLFRVTVHSQPSVHTVSQLIPNKSTAYRLIAAAGRTPRHGTTQWCCRACRSPANHRTHQESARTNMPCSLASHCCRCCWGRPWWCNDVTTSRCVDWQWVPSRLPIRRKPSSSLRSHNAAKPYDAANWRTKWNKCGRRTDGLRKQWRHTIRRRCRRIRRKELASNIMDRAPCRFPV